MSPSFWKRILHAGCALAVGAIAGASRETVNGNDIDRKVDVYSLRAYTRVENPKIADDQVVIVMKGAIREPWASDFKALVARYKADKRRFVIDISSGGGSVAEGRAIIAVLRELRKTHHLTTRVSRGETCLSMCVPVFLQGQDRVAARASVWMFHPVIKGQTHLLDVSAWEDLIKAYYLPAGVERTWLDSLRSQVGAPAEVWLTGGQLMDAKSGIFQRAIEDVLKLDPTRVLPDPETIARRGFDLESMPNG